MKALLHPATIIISRTDSIGDVVLTLPMAKALKEAFPAIRIGFMGKAYTRSVIEACVYVDQFIDVNQFLTDDVLINGKPAEAIIHVFPVSIIAKRAKEIRVPLRIGTTNRFYHWFTCNKLVKLSRKKSDLHEAQLNLKLLKALHIKADYALSDIPSLYGLNNIQPLENRFFSLLATDKCNLILHPKSQGSGREWGLENYTQLIGLLDENRYRIFVSGTEKERALLQPLFDAVGSKVVDICGMMSLPQFISFINSSDGLVASGTGPLHIAAALGKYTFGIFPPVRPIHPGRWAPVGNKAMYFESDINDEQPETASVVKVAPDIVWQAIENRLTSASQTS